MGSVGLWGSLNEGVRGWTVRSHRRLALGRAWRSVRHDSESSRVPDLCNPVNHASTESLRQREERNEHAPQLKGLVVSLLCLHSSDLMCFDMQQ